MWESSHDLSLSGFIIATSQSWFLKSFIAHVSVWNFLRLKEACRVLKGKGKCSRRFIKGKDLRRWMLRQLQGNWQFRELGPVRESWRSFSEVRSSQEIPEWPWLLVVRTWAWQQSCDQEKSSCVNTFANGCDPDLLGGRNVYWKHSLNWVFME